MNEKPGLFTIYLQLMKLRVVVLLQITAICAIVAHDLMVRSDAYLAIGLIGYASIILVTLLEAPWLLVVQMQSIWYMTET